MNGHAPAGANLPDGVLVARSLEGNKSASAALLERYRGHILRVAVRWGLCESEAADVFQNISIMLLERPEQLGRVSHLGGWLATLTRHECWRQKQRVQAPDDDPEPLLEKHADEGKSVEEAVARSEAQRALRSALGELDERCRCLLVQLYYTDPAPSYEAIAEALKMPRGSVGPTRSRCLKKLREIMNAQERSKG